VKKALHALTLTTALTLAGFAAAGTSSAAEYTSTCWLTCFSFGTGVTSYEAFNVTKADCCSGAALSCPPGSRPGYPAWGEPAELCPINTM
jgi:hypothetical protein